MPSFSGLTVHERGVSACLQRYAKRMKEGIENSIRDYELARKIFAETNIGDRVRVSWNKDGNEGVFDGKYLGTGSSSSISFSCIYGSSHILSIPTVKIRTKRGEESLPYISINIFYNKTKNKKYKL